MLVFFTSWCGQVGLEHLHPWCKGEGTIIILSNCLTKSGISSLTGVYIRQGNIQTRHNVRQNIDQHPGMPLQPPGHDLYEPSQGDTKTGHVLLLNLNESWPSIPLEYLSYTYPVIAWVEDDFLCLLGYVCIIHLCLTNWTCWMEMLLPGPLASGGHRLDRFWVHKTKATLDWLWHWLFLELLFFCP